MPDSEPTTVTLRGGLCVPLTALQLLWQLEDRGFRVRLDDRDGALVVSPGANLTPDDREAIRTHKPELLRLVAYCEAVQ